MIRLSWRARVRCVSAIVVLALTSSCGWKKTMTFQSPSGKSAIEIWQSRLANEWGLRVLFVSRQGRTELYEKRGEVIVNFVHVYWSSDESKVGVYATGLANFGLAFDSSRDAKMPFKEIREQLGESIRNTYHLSKEKDPFVWAELNDATSAFYRLHPEIRLSYH